MIRMVSSTKKARVFNELAGGALGWL